MFKKVFGSRFEILIFDKEVGRILGDLISEAEDESGTMIIESEVKSKDHFDVECSGNEADDEEDEENGFYTTN